MKLGARKRWIFKTIEWKKYKYGDNVYGFIEGTCFFVISTETDTETKTKYLNVKPMLPGFSSIRVRRRQKEAREVAVNMLSMFADRFMRQAIIPTLKPAPKKAAPKPKPKAAPKKAPPKKKPVPKKAAPKPKTPVKKEPDSYLHEAIEKVMGEENKGGKKEEKKNSDADKTDTKS